MEQNRPLGWTTLEEAKQLVEAGLDPNTADMHIIDRTDEHGGYFRVSLLYSKLDAEIVDGYYPCWSLGALEKLIPDEIKVNDVTFFYNASYDGIRKWYSSYTNEDLYRLIFFHRFQIRIEMLVQTVLFLLENNHIKKYE